MTSVNRVERWTKQEDTELLSMLAAGKSDTLIAAKLKRSMKDIQRRALIVKRNQRLISLGLEIPSHKRASQ